MTGGVDPSPARSDELHAGHAPGDASAQAESDARAQPHTDAQRTWSASVPHRRAAGTLVRYLPDGLLVLAPLAGEPIVMTGAAADVWRLVADPITFEDVVAVLAHHYGASGPIVDADLEPIWDRLVSLDALVVS